VEHGKALRIAYLVSQFPAVNHTYLLREIRGLRAVGVELYVASISNPDHSELSEEERDEASRAVYIKAQGLSGALKAHLTTLFSRPVGYLKALIFPLKAGRGDLSRTFMWFFYFIEAIMVGHWMMRMRLDHLHIHFSSNVGLIAREAFPITISVSIHGFGEIQADPVGFRLEEKIAVSLFMRAVSKNGRSQMMRLCPQPDWDKIEYAPLGVDPAEFRPRGVRPRGSPFELLCAGRLSPEKGQHVLVAALGRLRRESRDVRLHLVGDGPDRAALERDVKIRDLRDSVVFHGWMDQAGLRSLYEIADAFVLPSFAEGLPVVLMEAMACEIPCVSTWIAGIPELIENGVNGILVPPGDEVDLANAISKLMDSPPLVRQLGPAGRQRVLTAFDLKANVFRLAELFSSRLADCPAPMERTFSREESSH
jgi:colanic acid/amylovoran biosynthesis glycosyltransferase